MEYFRGAYIILDFLQHDDSVYVTTTVEASLLSDFCEYITITDSTFPDIPLGFFFSNTTPDWFNPDASQMVELGNHYDHALKRYTNPTHCLRIMPRIGLNITQMVTVFCIILVGILAGFVSFCVERYGNTLQTSDSSPKKSITNQNRFENSYYVKHVVDGGKTETWVCFNHRLDKDFYVKHDERNQAWICFKLQRNQ